MDRSSNLKIVKARTEPWDIVIIGGGATGSGCALDAASRGYSTLLVEQHDFGKGTSSRSTKLIHGGVRYLRQGNISLVREALRERSILLKNAPHVVRKQAFVIPCYSLWQKVFYGFGMKVYDLLAGRHNIGASRIISREETLRHLPNLKEQNLSGGVLYYDGQFDDTRLLIDILRTANERGAVVLNYAKVAALTKDAEGKINGLEFEDTETGEKFSVAAKCVINATGAFSDPVRKMSDAGAKNIITFAQGIHLVFDRKFLPSDSALMIPKTSDGRVLFCIPWHDHLMVGTTDTAVETAEIEPHALESEIDFILETAAEYLTAKPARDDILSIFAGIRPLVKNASNVKTSSLSRGHDLFVDASGLITITGGKWTTYRRMAEDAVDKAAAITGVAPRKCVTEDLPITGPPHTDIESERLHPDLPYTQADVMHAVRFEMARKLEDVLGRRTRALFLNAQAAVEVSRKVAEIMAAELRKDNDWTNTEVASFEDLSSSYSRPFA